jgi:hypothetical protein
MLAASQLSFNIFQYVASVNRPTPSSIGRVYFELFPYETNPGAHGINRSRLYDMLGKR